MPGRNRGGPPQPVVLPREALTPAAETACFELLAMLHNQRSDVLTIMLNNITVKGQPAESGFEITIRRA